MSQILLSLLKFFISLFNHTNPGAVSTVSKPKNVWSHTFNTDHIYPTTVICTSHVTWSLLERKWTVAWHNLCELSFITAQYLLINWTSIYLPTWRTWINQDMTRLVNRYTISQSTFSLHSWYQIGLLILRQIYASQYYTFIIITIHIAIDHAAITIPIPYATCGWIYACKLTHSLK